MRVFLGILTWLIATAGGVLAAGWFGLAGLGWSGEFFRRSYWEDGESEIGIGFAVVGLVAWLVFLAASVVVLRGGPHPPTRGIRVTSVVLTVISVALVATLCTLTIGWPEPPSEYPTPPWNRA